jgi:hypothetical protein
MGTSAIARAEEPALRVRVIVVPRPLAAHFHDRLAGLYEGRRDVYVIVDRRRGERRRAADGPPAGGSERRNHDRRSTVPAWSLPEMPARRADDPAAAGGARSAAF